tara:strand:- start:3929 stop:4360 length:432 start_codon:yes stop_codon:yes gene_type:complete
MNQKIETAINEMSKDFITFEKHELLRLYWYFANRQYQDGLFIEKPTKDKLPIEALKMSSKLHNQSKLDLLNREILELALPLICRATNEHFYINGDEITNGGKEGNDIGITYHNGYYRFTVTGHRQEFLHFQDLLNFTVEWLKN